MSPRGREEAVLRCQSHKEVARRIARESVVLLKNQGNLLPLSKNLKTVAVLGPARRRARFGGLHRPSLSGEQRFRAGGRPGSGFPGNPGPL